jgi:predicted dehydrogenase
VKFCIIGGGFWAKFQLAAWKQLGIVECVGVYDPDPIRRESLGVPGFDDVERMLAETKPDFVDIISPPSAHLENIRQSIPFCKNIICQKPLAEKIDDAELIVQECEAKEVRLFVHENWRYQKPIQSVARLLQGRRIGNQIFRTRIEFNNSFPVFANQPGLKNLERFILADLGIHLFDAARSLFGEAKWVFATTTRTDPLISGENLATVVMEFEKCKIVEFEMAYAAPLKTEAFPQTFIRVEGESGSIELGKDYEITITTNEGSQSLRSRPTQYSWMDPAYEVVHSSIADCNRAIYNDITEQINCGLRAGDNLKTLQLVEAAYQSAKTNQVVPIVTNAEQ